MADTPCLEYYYDAIPLCTNRGRLCYSQLIRTYTLRSRYEFDCLDAFERVKNFKTPAKTIPMSKQNPEISSTPIRRKRGRPKKVAASEVVERATKRKREEIADVPRRYGKRPIVLAPCDTHIVRAQWIFVQMQILQAEY